MPIPGSTASQQSNRRQGARCRQTRRDDHERSHIVSDDEEATDIAVRALEPTLSPQAGPMGLQQTLETSFSHHPSQQLGQAARPDLTSHPVRRPQSHPPPLQLSPTHNTMLRVLRTRRPQGCSTDAWTDTGGRPGVGSTDTGVSSEGQRPNDTEEAGLGRSRPQ